jgi:hypothetical protein
MSPTVAGTTTITAPHKRLVRKLAKDGVIAVELTVARPY